MLTDLELRVIQYFYEDTNGNQIDSGYDLQYRIGAYGWTSVQVIRERIDPPEETET